VAVHPLDWLTLKGNYGESYRVPGALELLGFKGSMFGDTLPNPDLKPEEAKSWDGGFEIERKSLKLGLNYFETEYRRKIVSTYTPAWETQFVNAKGKIWYKGFEGNASYDLGEAFDRPFMVRPYINFTALTECKASTDSRWASGDGLENKVPNVSDLNLAYGVNYVHPDIGFEADLRFTYVGRQYNYARWGGGGAEYERVGGQTIADLFLRQKLLSSDKSGTLSVFGEFRNLTNERYALIKDYPMPGRSFFIGLRYDY
jgi:vitamin B12 transporter